MELFGLNNAFILQGWRLHEGKEFLLWSVTAWIWRLLFSELFLFHAFWSWISYFDQILHFHLSSAVGTISEIFGAATEIGWKIEFHPYSTHTFGPSILLSKLEIFNYFVFQTNNAPCILSEIHCSRNFLNLVLIHLESFIQSIIDKGEASTKGTLRVCIEI